MAYLEATCDLRPIGIYLFILLDAGNIAGFHLHALDEYIVSEGLEA